MACSIVQLSTCKYCSQHVKLHFKQHIIKVKLLYYNITTQYILQRILLVQQCLDTTSWAFSL